jgi:hypothetical protein
MQGVTRGTQHPPRVVLYGPPKIGKSSFGAEAPSPIFLPTEDGIDGIEVDRFPRPTTWTDFLSCLERVASEEHEYQTLVIDTINGAAELAAAEVCRQRFGGDWGPKGYLSFQQGPVATSEEVRRLLPLLDQCRSRGLLVLLLAHTGTTRVPNPLDADYSKWVPDLDRRIWARLAAWADVIGRAEYQHTLRGADGKAPKLGERAKAIGTTVRVLRFAGSAAEDVGTRVGFDLPPEMPLSWTDFAAALGKADDGIAAEVRELWGLLTPDQAKSSLEWLGVKDLARASAPKLRQLLNRLRQVAAEKEGSDV